MLLGANLDADLRLVGCAVLIALPGHQRHLGPGGDRLQDLLRREAPRPFEVTEIEGVPSLSLVGPAAVRYALRLPRAAELRFSPELPLLARASAGAVLFRVTLESEDGGRKTRLRLVHDELPDTDTYDGHVGGWTSIVEKLASHVTRTSE